MCLRLVSNSSYHQTGVHLWCSRVNFPSAGSARWYHAHRYPAHLMCFLDWLTEDICTFIHTSQEASVPCHLCYPQQESTCRERQGQTEETSNQFLDGTSPVAHQLLLQSQGGSWGRRVCQGGYCSAFSSILGLTTPLSLPVEAAGSF